MKQKSIRPEIKGTRSGYVIRFTCPGCASENIIICKMPKDYFRNTHDASCKHCGQRLTILTPYNNKMDYRIENTVLRMPASGSKSGIL